MTYDSNTLAVVLVLLILGYLLLKCRSSSDRNKIYSWLISDSKKEALVAEKKKVDKIYLKTPEPTHLLYKNDSLNNNEDKKANEFQLQRPAPAANTNRLKALALSSSGSDIQHKADF